MKSTLNTILRSSVLALGALMTCCAKPPPTSLHSQSYLSDEHRFAEGVLLGAEYGTRTSAVRWVSSPSLSTIGATPEQKNIVFDSVREINSALSGTGIQIGMTNDGEGLTDMVVYFASLSELPEIAKKEGFEFVQGNVGFVWNSWNQRNELTRSVILIAADRLSLYSTRHVVLEETSQGMGLMDDSDLFSDSVFYSSPFDSGNTTTLAKRDRRLMRFFYSHIAPKDGARELELAFQSSWDSTPE